jgi:O-antigen chain-terminating methyltransferase
MTRIDQIAKDLERVAGDVDEKIEAHGNSVRSKIGDVLLVANEQSGRSSAYHAEAARAFSDLSHRLDALTIKAISGPSHVNDSSDLAKTQESIIGNAGKDTDGFSAFMDFFYHRLENRLRGSRLEIKNRLRIYLPDVKAAIGRTGMKTALDLGCGRGEWLELLREEGIAAKGIDLNAPQIAEAKGVGLDVENRDLMQVLQEAEDNSISVITAHHVVEHLDFPQVAWIAREAIRVLAPGGILIFETPSVRNMIVGSTSFHNDPTHVKPVTEPVLQVLFDAVGFFPVEVRHLHPHEKLATYLDKPNFDPELAYLLFGAQDVAVIGRKIVE